MRRELRVNLIYGLLGIIALSSLASLMILLFADLDFGSRVDEELTSGYGQITTEAEFIRAQRLTVIAALSLGAAGAFEEVSISLDDVLGWIAAARFSAAGEESPEFARSLARFDSTATFVRAEMTKIRADFRIVSPGIDIDRYQC